MPVMMTLTMVATSFPLHSAFIGAMAVGLGAALGALLRWVLSSWLNPLHDGIQLGTLVTNLIGGYFVGIAVTWFSHNPDISSTCRIFAVTGFLGGLTTFSTFSLEVVLLVQSEKHLSAAFCIAIHVFGSILATILGMKSASLIL